MIVYDLYWSIFAGPDVSGSAKMTHQPQGGRIVDKFLKIAAKLPLFYTILMCYNMPLQYVSGGIMATVTISEAARLAGISRTQLYRGFINKGKISVTKENDKVAIDLSELLRVFPSLKLETSEQIHNVTDSNNNKEHEQSEFVTLLKEQLKKIESQLAEAKEREDWLKQQIDELRQQQSNLLEDKTAKKRKKILGIF